MPVILKIIHNEDFNAKQKPLAMETGGFSTGETSSPQKLNWRKVSLGEIWFLLVMVETQTKSETFQQGVDNKMGWAKPTWNLVDS